MQACEPLPIFFWQIKFAYRPPHTIQTKGERDQGLSRVVVQFARQAAAFFLLHTRNQHGITAQFFLAATRAVQICQGLLQGMRANTQARADEGQVINGEERNQKEQPRHLGHNVIVDIYYRQQRTYTQYHSLETQHR